MEKAIKVLEDAVEKADFWIKILDGTPSSSGREEDKRQRAIYNDCKQALRLLRESQNAATSESALPISDVVKSLPSENKPRSMGRCIMCGKTNGCQCHGKW